MSDDTAYTVRYVLTLAMILGFVVYCMETGACRSAYNFANGRQVEKP